MIRRVALALLLLAGAGPAFADCSPPGMTVAGSIGERLGVYDADGKFSREIGRDELVPGSSLVDCDESLGLVKVALASGTEAWLDRAELKLAVAGQAETRKVCVQAASSRAADHKEAAVSGIDPKAPKDCVPPTPAKPARP
jgi:hypothetical protein